MASYRKEVLASIWQLKEEGILTDVTLKMSDGYVVACHKLVLMAASQFFRAMLRPKSGRKESTEEEITLECCSGDTFKMLLHYFYSGEIDLHAGNVQDIVMACDFLFG